MAWFSGAGFGEKPAAEGHVTFNPDRDLVAPCAASGGSSVRRLLQALWQPTAITARTCSMMTMRRPAN
eukprot:2639870-Prymnesium_polylepis.1